MRLEDWLKPDTVAILDTAIFYGIPKYGHKKCYKQATAPIEHVTMETSDIIIKHCSACGKRLMPYERIMITVRFRCGCEGIISEFRTPENESQARYREDAYHLCKHCQIKSNQTVERQARQAEESVSDHYRIDGHIWRVYRTSSYWQGRRYVNGKAIYKYFGKADPRPLLGEPLLEEVEE